MKNLTDIQKRRLASASQEALAKRQQWHLAQIMGAPKKREGEMRFDMMVADSQFLSLLKARGLRKGDAVRILTDGLYKNTVAQIRDIEDDFRLELNIDGTTVCPYPHEVELASAKSD